MSNTKIAPQWILVFIIWVSSVIAFSNSWQVAAEKEQRIERKLADGDSDIISIDCGVNEDCTDTSTNIRYQADNISFVDSGNVNLVSSIHTFDNDPQISKPLRSPRSFPEWKRNCYNLKPKQGINNDCLIRASIAYGNYDGKDQIPVFDLYFGVNYWTTIDGLKDASTVLRTEVVVPLSLTDVIDVCLVNTGQGVPFISLLEEWPLTKSVYQTSPTLLPLGLMTRRNLGVPGNESFWRYTDDPFGRSWLSEGGIGDAESFNTSSAINADDFTYYSFKLPTEVLGTAIMQLKLSSSIDFEFPFDNSFEYYAYLHFFDFEGDASQLRIMDIFYNVGNYKGPITPGYWSPYT